MNWSIVTNAFLANLIKRPIFGSFVCNLGARRSDALIASAPPGNDERYRPVHQDVWGQIGDSIAHASPTRLQSKANALRSISLTWKELTTQMPC